MPIPCYVTDAIAECERSTPVDGTPSVDGLRAKPERLA